ncbi:MAG TPA: signal recognition particle-docking protein FtsY [Armatimonadota bacterium]|nr:signal recognition particle-docking protein FtsY [Armatimonadota bacterium]
MLKGLFSRIGQLFLRDVVDEELLEELEELLVASDVSVRTAQEVVGQLRQRILAQHIAQAAHARDALKDILTEVLSRHQRPLMTDERQPLLYLMVGVNGTGKTTTIAKLAHRFRGQGKRVLLACADTFRAAAAEQLQVWASRIGVEAIAQQPGGDPAAVVFDAVASARARGVEVVIADTAGRLHTQRNLMEELRKVARVSERALGRPADEALLVLDATVGQNALAQAQQFAQAVAVTGIVLTKLDGTARGGAVVTIAHETGLPIKLIGTGEQADDLRDFDPRAFVEELFAPG